MAEGRGAVTAAGAATGRSVVFNVQRTSAGELTELAVTGSKRRTATRLVLDLSVRSSTPAGCAAGAAGTLTLLNGSVDELIVAATSVRVTLTRP